MQIAFYNHRVECRQELRWYKVLMVYNIDFRMVGDKPFRLLATCNKMDFMYPWSKLLNPPEPVLQETVISEPCFRDSIFSVLFFARELGKVHLPFRIVHVNPCNHKINFHILVFRGIKPTWVGNECNMLKICRIAAGAVRWSCLTAEITTHYYYAYGGQNYRKILYGRRFLQVFCCEGPKYAFRDKCQLVCG